MNPHLPRVHTLLVTPLRQMTAHGHARRPYGTGFRFIATKPDLAVELPTQVRQRMNTKPRDYLVGGGIGSLATAPFMIRDGTIPGANISFWNLRLQLAAVWMAPAIPLEAIPCTADAW